MKKLVIIFTFVFMLTSLRAQDGEIKSYPKHEVGFSVGALPIIGFIVTPNTELNRFDGDMGHTYHFERDKNYVKMYHLGSYSLTYNYHFNSKHSIGGSMSWVGKHIDTYWEYSSPAVTVNGSGWKHYFTLQGNYRNTYYRKNDRIALYWGISTGITLCIRDKDILPKETVEIFLGTESNVPWYFNPSLHFNAFGIEIGKKCILNMELGIGTQGLLITGFRYKI